MERHVRSLRRAVEVAGELAELTRALEDREGARGALIGAVAASYHGYVRGTEDVDLAVAVNPSTLSVLAARLRGPKTTAVFSAPDAQDSLGGVLRIVEEDTDPLELVNYVQPFRAIPPVGVDAIAEAIEIGDGLRVVTLAHLVALKLYAGGLKSEADVSELLRHNPDADRQGIRAVCARYDLATYFDAIARRSG